MSRRAGYCRACQRPCERLIAAMDATEAQFDGGSTTRHDGDRFAIRNAIWSRSSAGENYVSGESTTATDTRMPVPAAQRSSAATEMRRIGNFLPKAAYQGIVRSIDRRAGVFEAQLWPMRSYIRLSELSDHEQADSTFPLDAVSEDDAELLAIGGVFTWMTGYREGPGIPRRWESNLQFRRLPPRSDVELGDLAKGAAEYVRLFGDSAK